MRPDTSSPRSAALRGALWITLIALIATGAALTLQFVRTVTLIEARQRALVDDEATRLLDRYRSGGLLGVAQAIEREQQLPRLNEFFYLLANPDGTPVAGNLVAWPDEVRQAGYHSFVTEVRGARGASRQRRVEARAVMLQGGFRLLVGSLSDERAELRHSYISALIWSLLATGLLGLGLGFLYSRRGLAFLNATARTGERFLAGHLDERLPISGRSDEYDRLAETINQSFDEVERLVRSLRAATDGLAHDIKTPLTRIKARLELARIEQPSRAALQCAMADCLHDLDSLMQLIDRILELARAEESAAVGFVEISLDRIVAEALELFEPVATDRAIDLHRQIEPVKIEGSPSLLAQAVSNLLDNAIKFTPEGGAVSVELAHVDDQVQLVVSDSGPGIPVHERERALSRFSRLDESRQPPGSGLGLSIVATAARVHRARLELSEANPGLRVMLVFDRRDRSPTSAL